MDGDYQVTRTFLVVGPSQIGKDALIKLLVQRHGWCARINMTTRTPRQDEIDGVDYRFVKTSVFHEHILADAFVDWDYVVGNYYGVVADPAPSPSGLEVMHCLSRMAVRLSQQSERYVPVLFLPTTREKHRQKISYSFSSEQEVMLRLAMFDEELVHAALFRRIIRVDEFASSQQAVDKFLEYAEEFR